MQQFSRSFHGAFRVMGLMIFRYFKVRDNSIFQIISYFNLANPFLPPSLTNACARIMIGKARVSSRFAPSEKSGRFLLLERHSTSNVQLWHLQDFRPSATPDAASTHPGGDTRGAANGRATGYLGLVQVQFWPKVVMGDAKEGSPLLGKKTL